MTLLAAVVVVALGTPGAGNRAPRAFDVSPVPAAAALTVVDRAAAAGLVAAGVTVFDYSVAAGLFENNHTWSAKTVDYDADGDEDIWVGYHQWSGKLWRSNRNGTYTQVSTAAPVPWPRKNLAGKQPDRHDCAWADVNNDGRQDAYCAAGRNDDNQVKTDMDNELWLQTSTRTFNEQSGNEVATAWGVGDVCGRGRHVAFLDANGDAYPDLFLGNQTPRDDASDPCNNTAHSEESKLFLNKGDNTGFTVAPATYGVSGYGQGQRCAEVFDFNGDGRNDLIGCRLTFQKPVLYQRKPVNQLGFTEVAAASSGLTTAVADATVADLNNDGRPDLVFATRTEFTYRLNTGGRFGPSVRIAAVPSGEGRSVAVGDVDGDGDLDVYGLICNPNHSTNPNDILMINNGSQVFTTMTVPAAAGDGDEVITVHPTPGGSASFLVLNGGESGSVGPIQLIGTT